MLKGHKKGFIVYLFCAFFFDFPVMLQLKYLTCFGNYAYYLFGRGTDETKSKNNLQFLGSNVLECSSSSC